MVQHNNTFGPIGNSGTGTVHAGHTVNTAGGSVNFGIAGSYANHRIRKNA